MAHARRRATRAPDSTRAIRTLPAAPFDPSRRLISVGVPRGVVVPVPFAEWHAEARQERRHLPVLRRQGYVRKYRSSIKDRYSIKRSDSELTIMEWWLASTRSRAATRARGGGCVVRGAWFIIGTGTGTDTAYRCRCRYRDRDRDRYRSDRSVPVHQHVVHRILQLYSCTNYLSLTPPKKGGGCSRKLRDLRGVLIA